MTELYIDGCPIALEEGFTTDFFSKNTFFTKNGEFTYDIDVNLKIAINERIYKHIQRIHNNIYPNKRSATIVVDGRVLIQGTEVILSIEDEIAKIQIVSGNSELNYLSGNNKKIRDMDLGKIDSNITPEVALASLSGKYPNWNYVCTPVLKEYTKYPFNSNKAYSNAKMYNKISREVLNGLKFEPDAEFVPQPYLLYYINKVSQNLGYKIIENCLLDEPRNFELIAVNGIETLNYNQMIPNWEVDKFLTEMENFFNIVFLVNKIDKTIRILHIYDYYKNSKITYISKEQLIDDQEIRYNVNDNLNFIYKNVKYNLPGSSWYNSACLDLDLKKACNSLHVYEFDDLKTNISFTLYNELYIIQTSNYHQNYVMKKNRVSNVDLYYFELIDSFRNIIDESSDNETNLNIVPAEVMVLKLTGFVYVESSEEERTLRYYSALPYCRNTPSKRDGESEGLNEFIENGIPEESVPDKMFIALYKGIKPCFFTSTSYPETYAKLFYPMSLVHPFVVSMATETGPDGPYMINNLYKPGNNDDDLSLTYRYENLYNKNMNVNTSTEYIFKFLHKDILDPKSIFVIDNKKFYCKELHYSIELDGLNKVCEGTFYSM